VDVRDGQLARVLRARRRRRRVALVDVDRVVDVRDGKVHERDVADVAPAAAGRRYRRRVPAEDLDARAVLRVLHGNVLHPDVRDDVRLLRVLPE
jgi:hypothetical protein